MSKFYVCEPKIGEETTIVLVDNDDHSILGEVSKDALTYTEAYDIIPEEAIKKSKFPMCPKCGSYTNDGFCPEDIECEIDKRRTVVYIKCPHCKHFH